MLNNKLDKYLKEDYYPFHMPGHKRNTEILNKKLPYKRDLTEISGFDNLNDPKTIFVDMEKALANIYKAKDAIISTNGSTSGILATIRSMTNDTKRILISRSSHKSVYNAIEVFGLDSYYIENKTDQSGLIKSIDYEDLKEKLSSRSYDFVMVTSPSYEGYMLDLNKIHDLCKLYNTYLIVDMAHGSHIHLYKEYEKYFSYDIAITSFHKNLSSLTPASCVLVNNNEVDSKELRRNMAIFQTSSPSYIISQSIDDMINNHHKFPNLKKELDINLGELYKIKLNRLKLLNEKNKDRTKILISTKDTNITGYRLGELLREKKLEIEMAQASYVILIASIFDKKEGFIRLKNALTAIDKNLEKSKYSFDMKALLPEKKMSIAKALKADKIKLDLSELEKEVSGQYIYSYPPGIPLIVPGEVFSKNIIDQISYLDSIGANLSFDDGKIFVIYWQFKANLILF